MHQDREQSKRTLSEERFRLLVESVQDYGVFMLSPSGVVTSWNVGAARLKGYTADEIIGEHFSIFYPPGDGAAGKCERELETARVTGRFEEEGWRVRKDGSLFWANVTITALRDVDSTLVGFAKVTRDLTDRKEAERLARELAVKEAALAEKVLLEEFQQRFVAVLGHDLRNPLAAIQMGAGVLRKLSTDEKIVRVVDRVESSARRMTRMIEQILDLTRSRLAAGIDIAAAPMNLRDTLVAVVDELRSAHPERTIALECTELPGSWDADRLAQVFSNVIGNAIHHGSPSEPVRVVARLDAEQVMVRVHNGGPAIPASIQAELFSPYRRGSRDSRTAATAGLGLGLYISREIVVTHGGEIRMDSTEAKGTTFWITLPCHAPHDEIAS